MILHKLVGRRLHAKTLSSSRIILRSPTEEDWPQWSQLRRENEERLRPLEPKWSLGELSREAFQDRLKQHNADHLSQRGCHWQIFLSDGETMAGGIALTGIRHGGSCSAQMGYWLGSAFTGCGYMREAVNLACRHAFQEQKLNRVQAGTLPDNARSIAVLLNSGFQQEGVARGYMQIDGKFRDHLIFARLASDCSSRSEGGNQTSQFASN